MGMNMLAHTRKAPSTLIARIENDSTSEEPVAVFQEKKNMSELVPARKHTGGKLAPATNETRPIMVPPVLGEVDVEKMRQHIPRTTLRYAMLTTVYHGTFALNNNHLIHDRGMTCSVTWYCRFVNYARASRQVRHGPLVSI